MAEVINPCRARVRGEQQLAAHLERMESGKLVLAFSIGALPGCREIDLLLVHKEIGVFIIEVKSFGLDAIEGVSPGAWQVKGRASRENPLVQAYDQFEFLRNYWEARFESKINGVTATACFPNISRNEWLEVLGARSYADDISEGVLFSEDLISIETLEQRLAIARRRPAIRSAQQAAKVAPKLLADIRALFAMIRPVEPTLSERQRIDAIEKRITAETRKRFPTTQRFFASFSGGAGTGKTFRLLSIGTAHAYEGKRVLFVCFNKTLGSDVKRLLSFNNKLSKSVYGIHATDVFQSLIRSAEINCINLDVLEKSFDDWGARITASLTKKGKEGSSATEKYDLILVDESQDMKEWQLDYIQLHAGVDTSICIAAGRGQELYNEGALATHWLDFLSQGRGVDEIKLPRNYRNPREQYFAALSFHEAWPNKFEKIQKTLKKVFANSSDVNRELDFGRAGEPINYQPLPALTGEFDCEGRDQVEIVSAFYRSVIETELAFLESESSKPVGLLILVPGRSGMHLECAIRALDHISEASSGEVRYIDYTDENRRRAVAHSEEVRISTFHSARGLEGECVIIFGLERIEQVAQQANVKPENLGYIALSRGVFRTVVVARTFVKTAVHDILKGITVALDSRN